MAFSSASVLRSSFLTPDHMSTKVAISSRLPANSSDITSSSLSSSMHCCSNSSSRVKKTKRSSERVVSVFIGIDRLEYKCSPAKVTATNWMDQQYFIVKIWPATIPEAEMALRKPVLKCRPCSRCTRMRAPVVGRSSHTGNRDREADRVTKIVVCRRIAQDPKQAEHFPTRLR